MQDTSESRQYSGLGLGLSISREARGEGLEKRKLVEEFTLTQVIVMRTPFVSISYIDYISMNIFLFIYLFRCVHVLL